MRKILFPIPENGGVWTEDIILLGFFHDENEKLVTFFPLPVFEDEEYDRKTYCGPYSNYPVHFSLDDITEPTDEEKYDNSQEEYSPDFFHRYFHDLIPPFD